MALIACPCHLVLWIPLLAGTSAGAWLAQFQGLLFGVMTAIFLVAGYLFVLRLQAAEKRG